MSTCSALDRPRERAKNGHYLRQAIISNDLKKFRDILKRRGLIDINAVGTDTYPPIHLTVRDNKTEMVRLLLDYDRTCHELDINVYDTRGYTALHRAAAGSPIEIVRMLLDAAAKVNQSSLAVPGVAITSTSTSTSTSASTSTSTFTPLDMAVNKYRTDVCELLCASGAECQQLIISNSEAASACRDAMIRGRTKWIQKQKITCLMGLYDGQSSIYKAAQNAIFDMELLPLIWCYLDGTPIPRKLTRQQKEEAQQRMMEQTKRAEERRQQEQQKKEREKREKKERRRREEEEEKAVEEPVASSWEELEV